MKRFVVAIAVVAVLITLTGWAVAHGPGGRWMGMGSGQGMGPGHMWGGGGMMGGGAGPAGCPGMAAATGGPGATRITEQITEEKAKTLAQEYADKYLQGFTVEKVLPFQGRMHTMYSVELKGPGDEVRVLHVNPFGNVMPFGGPQRRGA